MYRYLLLAQFVPMNFSDWADPINEISKYHNYREVVV